MDRRDFFRRSAVVASGVVAADQLELLERLGWKRRFFPGWSAPAIRTDSEWPMIYIKDGYGWIRARDETGRIRHFRF